MEKLLVTALILGILVVFAFVLPEYIGNTMSATGLVANETITTASQKAGQIRDLSIGVTLILFVLLVVPAVIGAIRRR